MAWNKRDKSFAAPIARAKWAKQSLETGLPERSKDHSRNDAAPLLPLNASCALFLDFDGTLTPIQDNPHTVFLPKNSIDVLHLLLRVLDGALVIISGREVRDLTLRVPANFWRVGGHGADICPPGSMPFAHKHTTPAPLLADAAALCKRLKGVRLEPKGPILAFHYRAAPALAAELTHEVRALLPPYPGYAMQMGKMVIELRPKGLHKGTAVRDLMQRPPFQGRRPIMVGDDATDEDAMAACLELGGTAVKVGREESVAPFRLADTKAVWTWLRENAERQP
jgi:trehalose 6-phosphate phosphatase